MHPAPSVIAFTVLSGMGFGLLAFLGMGMPVPSGGLAFLHWGLGYALAVLAAVFLFLRMLVASPLGLSATGIREACRRR